MKPCNTLFIAALLFITACNAPGNKNENTAGTPPADTLAKTPPVTGTPTDTDNTITEKYWKLTELFGKPVASPAENTREPHMVIREDDNKVNGHSGCNNFFGTYTINEGSRITFSQIGATKMACLNGMEVETEFFKALEMTDNYSLRGDSLSLNKARMAPLARFVVMYLP